VPPPVREVGLSATLAPIEEVAEYLVGYQDREAEGVNHGGDSSASGTSTSGWSARTDDMTSLPYEIVNSKMYTSSTR
jgi:ATP-dependent Lhr-like helicase